MKGSGIDTSPVKIFLPLTGAGNCYLARDVAMESQSSIEKAHVCLVELPASAELHVVGDVVSVV